MKKKSELISNQIFKLNIFLFQFKMKKDLTVDNFDCLSKKDFCSDQLNNIFTSKSNSKLFSFHWENLSLEQMSDIFKDHKLNDEENIEENLFGLFCDNKGQAQYFEKKNEIDNHEKEKEKEITQSKVENINLNLYKNIENNKDNKIKQKKLLGKKLKSPGELENKEKITKNNNKKLFISKRDSQRKIQIDNYSIFLFEAIYHWIKPQIEKQIPNSLSQKNLYPPLYKDFTHNTNNNYIRFFLDIPYKYILQMTNIDKVKLEELFVFLKIKKPKKEKAIKLSDKEYYLAKALLEVYHKIQLEEMDKIGIEDTNEESGLEYLNKSPIKDIDREKIESEIIELLKKEGYKDENENTLSEKDIVRLNQLFVEFKVKNIRDFQNRNKTIINEIEQITEIKELNMTLRKIIIQFLKSKDYQSFYENKSKDIEKYFESLNKYKLSEIYGNNTCGFIMMVENKTKKNEKKCKI